MCRYSTELKNKHQITLGVPLRVTRLPTIYDERSVTGFAVVNGGKVTTYGVCVKSGYEATLTMTQHTVNKLGLSFTGTTKFIGRFIEAEHRTDNPLRHTDAWAIYLGKDAETIVNFDSRWHGVNAVIDLAPGNIRTPTDTTPTIPRQQVETADTFLTYQKGPSVVQACSLAFGLLTASVYLLG